jgi:hypothetical protein
MPTTTLRRPAALHTSLLLLFNAKQGGHLLQSFTSRLDKAVANKDESEDIDGS